MAQRRGVKSASQTPAPKADKIIGSKNNKKGTAASESSAASIKLSSNTMSTLSKKLQEFKEKYPSKKNVSLNDLKAVYRRGSGAYSQSHRPFITGGKPNSRAAWSFARVNKFLEKAAGKKVKAAYVQDDDLMKYANGGKVEKLIEQGVVDLKFYKTTIEHANTYGFESTNPLFVQFDIKNKISDVLQYLDEYAKDHNHDLIFGHIEQKSEPSIDVIKNMLQKNGYSTIEGNNDFYKYIDANVSLNDDLLKYEGGGNVGVVTKYIKNIEVIGDDEEGILYSGSYGNSGVLSWINYGEIINVITIESGNKKGSSGTMAIASLFLLNPKVQTITYQDNSHFEDGTSFWIRIGGDYTDLERSDFFNYFQNKFGYNPDIRYADGGEIKSFFTWFHQWYKGISDKMNIIISLPNQTSGLKTIPYQEENVVILDLFEKTDQSVQAKTYLKKIIDKADEYGVTLYLFPEARHKYIKDELHKKKITREYIIQYYKDFGFELTSDEQFMRRIPKYANGGKAVSGVEGDVSQDPIGYADGGQVNNCKEFILQNKSVLTNGFYFNMNDLSKLFDPYGQVPTHLDFTLVSYNSGGQSNLDVINTINPTTLVDKLSQLLGLEKNQSYAVVHYVISKAKRLTNINQITTEKIVVVDRDMVVCENLNEYAAGGKYHLGGDMSLHLAPNGKPSNLTHEQWHLVRTPEFKAWFGDWENDPENASQVVDENGEPLILYRGNLVNQEELGYTFNLGENFLKKQSGNTFGFFFTKNIDIAKKYMLVDHFDEIRGGSLTEVFIKSNKILDLKDFDLKISQNSFVEGLIQKGIIFDNELEKRILDFDSDTYEYWGNNVFDYFDVFPELRNLFIKNGFNSVIFYEMSRSYSKYQVYVAFNSNQIKLADGTNKTFDANNPDIRYKDGGTTITKFKNEDMEQMIQCVQCDWTWSTSDSDEADKYVCHNCGFDNSLFYDTDILKPTLTIQEIAEKHNEDIDYVIDQLVKGTEHEMEHTDNIDVAKKIALHHVAETPDYYEKLEKMGLEDGGEVILEDNSTPIEIEIIEYLKQQMAESTEVMHCNDSRVFKTMICKTKIEIAEKRLSETENPEEQNVWNECILIWSDAMTDIFENNIPVREYKDGGTPCGCGSVYEKGGLAYGNSHDKGGMPLEVSSTGQKIEIEGGEGVVNKRSMQMTKKLDFQGKKYTPCEVVSKINEMGGGVKFKCSDVNEIIAEDGHF